MHYVITLLDYSFNMLIHSWLIVGAMVGTADPEGVIAGLSNSGAVVSVCMHATIILTISAVGTILAKHHTNIRPTS